MRLHRLEVTAFGPFAATESVDFDALATSGLFLFTGATGAGKTSILDAVCFALYGHVPGARDASRSMRSDHADERVRAQVLLEVTLRGRRLRITRSPQWDRPKLRGSGVTTEPAKVHLEERASSGWTTLSTRMDETGQLVGDLLGLSLAQFCQVVLLPQGQFAEFLRADAEKRRELLESLFDTRRFADVERWLVARRQESARALDDVDQRVAQVVARIIEAAGLDVPTEVEAAHAPQWVAALLDDASIHARRGGGRRTPRRRPPRRGDGRGGARDRCRRGPRPACGPARSPDPAHRGRARAGGRDGRRRGRPRRRAAAAPGRRGRPAADRARRGPVGRGGCRHAAVAGADRHRHGRCSGLRPAAARTPVASGVGARPSR